MGRRNPSTDWPHFFLAGDIHDIITHARFGDDRLRGSWAVWGLKFSISHWLCWSSLQLSHYRVSVIYRDADTSNAMWIYIFFLHYDFNSAKPAKLFNTCKVTWRQRSRDHFTRHKPFPIGGPLKPSLYRQPFWGYYALTRNTLDCDQSNYSSPIVFSHIPIEFGQTGISAIRSADPENPILEPKTE